MLLGVGCGARPISSQERGKIERLIPAQANELIRAGELPDRTPMRSVELVRTLFMSHPKLRERLPTPLTFGELKNQSIRRPGRGHIGDLIIFYELPRALDLAIITEVLSPTRYKAIAILLGAVKQIEIDLDAPSARRRGDEVINTVIRSIKEDDSSPHLYLAGELVYEFRSLF